jgi:nicotinate phosphoribosyltransferase
VRAVRAAAVHTSTRPDANDPGLLSPEQVALLTDQYELAMAASYLRHGMDDLAVFELFVRRLPPRRQWLMACGIGPALALVQAMRFGHRELDYLHSLGFGDDFLEHLAAFRFTGDVDALPEGIVFFPHEPVVRVTARRIEAQLLETLLLNQINFQTMVATKAARLVLSAGDAADVVDFSPRRDHGSDAAMKAARAAVVAGASGTSNVAAAMRYGLRPLGTMAHSYVMSFASEEEAFRTFMIDFPNNAVMLVDTYDTIEGVRRAIAASRATGVPLAGVRLDSGDLLELSRAARALLDEAGMVRARIVASGDLEERAIAALVAAGAPIDTFGVGTDLGTSRDSPVVNGVYKLVAHYRGGRWLGLRKRSPAKATVPGAKQVFRVYRGGVMAGDTIALHDERPPGEALLVPFIRAGTLLRRDPLGRMRKRAESQLAALPQALLGDERSSPYPVEYSPACGPAAAAASPEAV